MLPRRGVTEVSDAIWLRDARLPVLGSLARGTLSIVIVALGASLGREAAPQQAGASAASALSDWAGLPTWQRRLLVACGAGAGMAAVYNVPLGGALFALEVLLGTLTLPLVLPALATSVIATAVAWIALPDRPDLQRSRSYGVHTSEVVWALIVGPLAGLASIAYIRLIARAHDLRPAGDDARCSRRSSCSPRSASSRSPTRRSSATARTSSRSRSSAGSASATIAVLLVLKPLATAACLGSGAPGGLFTPTLAFGVLLGGLLGEGWSQLWPGAPLGALAIIGAAAVLGASMQGPVAAVVLLLELTRTRTR